MEEKKVEKLINKKIIPISVIAGLVAGGLAGAIIGFFVITNSQSIIPLLDSSILNLNKSSAEKTIHVEIESAITEVVEQSSPAVVSIIVTKDLPKIEKYYIDPFSNDPYLRQFFGDDFLIPQQRQKGFETREIGGGTGFIVSEDGLIVTNKHVVLDEDADYTVLTNKEEKYEAKVIARDPINDLAILKIDKLGLPTLDLADSANLKLGQSVIVIGNALGEYRNTVSTGVISGLSRSITAGGSGFVEELSGVIQTDAAINPGNSGGPLLDLSGKVIGVSTAIAVNAENIGFAIPINDAKKIIENVKKYGRIVRPFLGVRYIIINEAVAEENNLEVGYGALIIRGEERSELAVIPGSPADKAGLAENDIILEVNGERINRQNSLAKLLFKYSVGDEIKLKILHKGVQKDVSVILVEFKE